MYYVMYPHLHSCLRASCLKPASASFILLSSMILSFLRSAMFAMKMLSMWSILCFRSKVLILSEVSGKSGFELDCQQKLISGRKMLVLHQHPSKQFRWVQNSKPSCHSTTGKSKPKIGNMMKNTAENSLKVLLVPPVVTRNMHNGRMTSLVAASQPNAMCAEFKGQPKRGSRENAN